MAFDEAKHDDTSLQRKTGTKTQFLKVKSRIETDTLSLRGQARRETVGLINKIVRTPWSHSAMIPTGGAFPVELCDSCLTRILLLCGVHPLWQYFGFTPAQIPCNTLL